MTLNCSPFPQVDARRQQAATLLSLLLLAAAHALAVTVECWPSLQPSVAPGSSSGDTAPSFLGSTVNFTLLPLLPPPLLLLRRLRLPLLPCGA
jgi:hypothetical protein